MCLIKTNVVMFHVWFRYCTFVDLVPPEGEYGHSVTQATVHIHKIICLELFLCFPFFYANQSKPSEVSIYNK